VSIAGASTDDGTTDLLSPGCDSIPEPAIAMGRSDRHADARRALRKRGGVVWAVDSRVECLRCVVMSPSRLGICERWRMSIQDEVLVGFFERLAGDDAVSDAIVERLREGMAHGNIPKPATLLEIIVQGSGDDTA
jgi:hypothetical protein